MIDSKVAVITAGGGGMGAAVTRELHQRGYRVALMSRSEAAEQLAAELGGVGLRGSVTDASALQSLVDETLSRFGRIDALVNHTAHPPKGELLDITDEIRDMVTGDASTDEIRNLARTQGMTTLREAGLKLIFDGITTIDEIVRETVLEDVE